MKKQPLQKKADDKSDYNKELDQIGKSSNFEKENTNLLKQMYVGNKNKKNVRVAGNKVELPTELDDAPILALDLEYPNESFNSDEVEEKFFVDESEMETQGLKDSKELYRTHVNPAGTKDTAPRATETPFDVSAKDNARQKAREAQARIANAKNLAELIFAKNLVQREQLPKVAKLIASLDNKAFGFVKSLFDELQTNNVQTRKATASVSEKGLQQPIHMAKPLPKGNSFAEQFADAPWDGVPSQADVNAFKQKSNGY